MKAVNIIGGILACLGLIAFLFGGGAFVQDKVTDASVPLLVGGFISAALGLVLANFKEEWIFEE